MSAVHMLSSLLMTPHPHVATNVLMLRSRKTVANLIYHLNAQWKKLCVNEGI